MLKARDLTGSFDKPRYVTYTEDLCAHSRSKIVGCRRCLDLCPTGAITPNGDHVAINANICAGCGQCAAACPTGAAAYALPTSDALLRKLRALLATYAQAGGKQAVVLFHDAEHGGEMIEALARHGDGLPANVLPVQINEVTQVGLEAIAALLLMALRRCASSFAPSRATTSAGLAQTVALAATDTCRPRICRRARRHHRDRRSGCAGRSVARDSRHGRRGKARHVSPPSAQNAKWCGWHCASCMAWRPRRSMSSRCRRARRSARVEVNVEGCTLCLSCVPGLPDRRA